MSITSADNRLHAAPYWQQALAWLTLDRLLVGVCFIIIGAATLTITYDPDSWWALRTGQLTWDSGQVWTIDRWSSTVPGAYWPNHSWLTQLIFYVAYLGAGLAGPVLFCGAVALATWLMLYRLGGGPPRYRALLLLAAVASHVVVWTVRPHLLTLLLLTITLALIRRRRLHWLIPPLFLLWSNLHGGVGLGGVVLLAAVGAALLCRRSALLRWLAICGASAAATLVNPLGIGMWHFTLSKLTTAEALYVSEWLPPSLSRPVGYPFFVLAILWVPAALLATWVLVRPAWAGSRGDEEAGLAAPARPWPDSERLWLMVLLLSGGVYLLLGFRSIRNTPLFTVAALPLLMHPRLWRLSELLPQSSQRTLRPVRSAAKSIDLQDAVYQAADLTGLCRESSLPAFSIRPGCTSWRRGLFHAVLAGLVLTGCMLAAVPALVRSATLQPMAPGVISAVRGCSGTLYNTFAIGGELLWFVPERPVFVDSRNDPYPPDLILRAVIAEQHGDYRDLFAEYAITCALVPTNRAIYGALHSDQDWSEIYQDARLAVFAHTADHASQRSYWNVRVAAAENREPRAENPGVPLVLGSRFSDGIEVRARQ